MTTQTTQRENKPVDTCAALDRATITRENSLLEHQNFSILESTVEGKKILKIVEKKFPAILPQSFKGEYSYVFECSKRDQEHLQETVEAFKGIIETAFNPQDMTTDDAFTHFKMNLVTSTYYRIINDLKVKFVYKDVVFNELLRSQIRDQGSQLSIDHRSGAYTNLISEVGVSQIKTTLNAPNLPLVFIFIDYNGIGCANLIEKNQAVDQVFANLNRLSQTHFGKEIVVARLGGDEFAICASSVDVDSRRVNDFVKHLNQDSERVLGGVTFNPTQKGSEVLRDISRSLKKLYYYASFLLGESNRIPKVELAQVLYNYKANLKSAYEKWNAAKVKGEFKDYLSHRSLSKKLLFKSFFITRKRILSASVASVKSVSPKELSLDVLKATCYQATRAVGKSKGDSNGDIVIQERDLNLSLRRDDRNDSTESELYLDITRSIVNELRSYGTKITELSRRGMELYLMQTKASTSIGGELVLQAGQIQEQNVVSFFPELLDTDIHLSKISLTKFAKYNSTFDYHRADKISEIIFKNIRKYFPDAKIVKDGGGDFFILQPKGGNFALSLMQSAINDAKKQIHIYLKNLNEQLKDINTNSSIYKRLKAQETIATSYKNLAFDFDLVGVREEDLGKQVVIEYLDLGNKTIITDRKFKEILS